jgi:hypothetical protein
MKRDGPLRAGLSTLRALIFCRAKRFVVRSLDASASQYFEATPVGSFTVSYVHRVCFTFFGFTVAGEDVSAAIDASIPRFVCFTFNVLTMVRRHHLR